MALANVLPEAVAVAPTETTIQEYDCTNLRTLTVQITNTDGSQTLVCSVYRRQYSSQAWALSALSDFALLAAGQSVVADLDVSSTGFIKITGYMSGAGGDCVCSARRLSK